MLLGSFYKITDLVNEKDRVNATVQFNSTHPIFSGHFPDLPVVPGVCQMQMLNEVLNFIYKKNFFMERAGQIKFLNLLNPVKTPQLQMDIKLSNDKQGVLVVNANYFWQDIAYFRFKGEFQ